MALETNLVSYYTLNGHTNDLVGSSDGVNDGAVLIDGKVGRGYEFPENSLITMSNFPSLVGKDFTVSAWVYINTVTSTSTRVVFSQSSLTTTGKLLYCGITSDGYLRTGFFADDETGDVLVTTGWHYLTFTHDYSTKVSNFYIDTVDAGSGTHSGVFSGNSTTYLGAYTNKTGDLLSDLDEVGIWDKILTSTEITELYNSGDGKTYYDGKFVDDTDINEEIVSYYKLDETSGDAIDALGFYDLAENGTVPEQTGIIGGSRGVYSTSNAFSNTGVYSLTHLSDFSFNIWIYRTGTGAESRFLSVFDGASTGVFYFNMRIDVSNKIRVVTTTSGSAGEIDITSTSSVPLDTWTMITFTHQGGSTQTGNIYINSATPQSDTGTTSGDTASAGLYIGAEGASITKPLTYGYLDEVGYWARVLSQSEVTELYNSGSGFAYPFIPTVGWSFKIYGILPSKIHSLPIDNISKVNGV